MTYFDVNGITYVPFRAGLKHPKLSWFILMLNRYGIRHLTIKHDTLTGPMLYLERGTVELANGILTQELAVFTAITTNFEEGPPVTIAITIDDLPDHHAFFSKQIEGQEITKITPTLQEPVIVEFKRDTADPVDILEVIEIEGKVIEEDVVVALEDVTTDDDDDDDDWGFDEVSLEAEDEEAAPEEVAQEEPKPVIKKKKDKPVPKPTNDPDFEVATTPPSRNVPITGTEFLQADEVLAFEDVTFPEVKKPIRMYDVNSSNISAIGAKITSDPLIVTMYIRFKTGANVYRYNPIATADWNSTLNEAVRRQQGIMEASVGSFYYHTIKIKAEEGEIKCQRLVPESDSWVHVLPKAARTKEIKERAK